MAFIPEGAKWYLAEIVNEITVEGDPRNVVHTNLVLVRADSPNEAYEKALDLGKGGETFFQNPAGKRVDIKFFGLHSLNVIYDELEHGAELSFHEKISMRAEELRKWIRPKEKLAVFAAIKPSSGPDYASGDIVREALDMLYTLRPDSSRHERNDNES